MGFLRIRNWDRWQTYRKDRSAPPWIKVHCRLLHDPNWISLSDMQKGQLISLWILASDRNGSIPDDKNMLKILCCLEHEPDIDVFISLGFIENPMSTKKKNVGNQEKNSGMSRNRGRGRSREEADTRLKRVDGLDEKAWGRWVVYREEIRKPIKPASLEAAQKQLASFGQDQSAVVERSIANGWQGLFPLTQGGKVNGFPQSDDDWMAKGREMGIHAKPGESMKSYTARIKTAMEGQHGHA